MAVEFLVLDSKVCKKYVIFGQSSKFEWPNLISNLEGTLASNKEKSDSLEFSFFFPFYVPLRAVGRSENPGASVVIWWA